ncbi:nucleotidyltransferase domain-containing protein [Clostridium botulinum]|uniref:nucleotidyltransferase domain-containing protein n=1 Tax=Clostridium botulinum TaxID=1491 RepID=UPI0019521194
MFGLLERDIKYINEVLDKFEEIEKAIIFGSRAMGNYKKGSDVDIAIIGKNVTNKNYF